MKLTNRWKWLLLAGCGASLLAWLATSPTRHALHYDAETIYDSVPTDCPINDVLHALPVPPGDYRTSRRISYMWSGSWLSSEDDPPLRFLSWEFDTGHISVGVDQHDRAVTKQFGSPMEFGESTLDWFKRVTRLDRWF